MKELLIDERGRGWPINDARLIEQLGDHEIGSDVAAHAVWRLGFAYLRPHGEDLVIAFRPRLICQPTLVGIFSEIHRRRPRRVILSYGIEGNTSEGFADLQLAMLRIEQIVASAARSQPRGLSARRRPLSSLLDMHEGRMVSLAQAWAETRHQWSPAFYDRLQRKGFLDNAVVVRKPRDADDLLIEHWGRKRDLFGPTWVRRARGKHVEEQPYENLARWVARLFRESISANEPRLDAISVAIRLRGGAVRARHYDRLLLPWQTEEGDAFALTVNVFRDRDGGNVEVPAERTP